MINLRRSDSLIRHAVKVAAGIALLAGLASGTVVAQSRGPLSPEQAIKSFQLKNGFRIELVAAEPQIMSPVAMAFDERGRLFVAELHAYPHDGTAEGEFTNGKIKMLEDRDGDGFYETSSVFADGLGFVLSVCPWNGGLLVASTPDILYLRDTDGDGRADERRVLYTGFGRTNNEQLVNALQFGVDNWIYGANGGNPGDVRRPDRPDEKPLPMAGRFFRFRMSDGTLEPMSGGGQYGLAADEFQRWFTCSNARHLNHIVLPDHYLKRNPYFAAPAVMTDIPDHGAAARLFRISPPEAWRVARTRMRAESAERSRFPLTELVPAGYVTAAAGNVIYQGDLFPEEYRGNSFVCDAANNVIHRDVLVPNGPTFIAKRAADEQESEFLASPDNWFRPVFLSNGPEGALYVVDFHREIVETPLSLPDEIKKTLDLNRGHDMGRIYRIVPADAPKPGPLPKLASLKTAELVEQLNSPNIWPRLTAQRLIFERQDKSAVKQLEAIAQTGKLATARLHALWTLEGLESLNAGLIRRSLRDDSPGVREHSIRLAELHLEQSPELATRVVALASDRDPRVRFQCAFTLGAVGRDAAAIGLGQIAARDAGDPWTRAAVMSSAADKADRILECLASHPTSQPGSDGPNPDVVRQLAEIVGARHHDKELTASLRLIAESDYSERRAWQFAALDGLATGLGRGGKSLRQVLANPPADATEAAGVAAQFVQQASVVALDANRDPAQRVAALRLVGQGVAASEAPNIAKLLSPQTAQPVQMAAVRALSAMDSPEVGKLLVANWPSYSPPVRREVQEALFARANRIPNLLGAIEAGDVQAGELDAARRDQLLNHKDSAIKARAKKLLASQIPADRQKVIDEHAPVLKLPGTVAKGKEIFKKHCATCHRLGGEGVEVGADLTAIRTKTREMLLIDILDPSRNMEPRFTNYVVATKSGQVLTGMISAETATSLTLRRAERAEDTILRSDVEEIRSTGKSLMPDGLEKQLSSQDLADLMEFLRSE